MAKIKLPRYVRQRSGSFYFVLPAWAFAKDEKGGQKEIAGFRCPLPPCTPLGRDLGAACVKAGGTLLPQWDDWLAGATSEARPGSVQWVFDEYKAKCPGYADLAPRTRKDYDKQLSRLADMPTKDGKSTLGFTDAKRIGPAQADQLYARLIREVKQRQASYAMQVARLVWNWAKRQKHVDENPFAEMRIKMAPKEQTHAVTRQEYEALKKAAKDLGLQPVATAIALAFELVQRPGDVIGREGRGGKLEGAMKWADYRPGESFAVLQNKTGKFLPIPLMDREGPLFPDLEAELQATRKTGTNIVMDEDNITGVPIPMKPHKFARLFRKVRDHAGLSKEVQFRGLRHGAATELGDAGVRDIRALSGHSQMQMADHYNQASAEKARQAQRARRVALLLQAEIEDALTDTAGGEK